MIGKGQIAQKDHIGVKIEYRAKTMGKPMILVASLIHAALVPMRLQVANGSSA